MGQLIDGDDGHWAEEVGSWAEEKHELLRRYVDITRSARIKFTGQGKAGATYIDPFCGPGRARVRRTNRWIDGSCVAAWKKSVQCGAPYSKVYIGDIDEARLYAARDRLKALGAPVETFLGTATETVQKIILKVNPSGLHFAFIDPFSLGALSFDIIKTLSKLKRIDMLVHVSKMDLQRNLGLNLSKADGDFDVFAPGWRKKINLLQNQSSIRVDVFDFWKELVRDLGVWPSTDMRLVKGSKNQPLYWLLLAAKHQLAHEMWASASKTTQGDLFK